MPHSRPYARCPAAASVCFLLTPFALSSTTRSQRTQPYWKHYGIVNYYALVFLLCPPDLLRCERFFERKNVSNSQESGVHTQCAAIVNHYTIVNLLRRANLLRCSIFSTAGSFGLGQDSFPTALSSAQVPLALVYEGGIGRARQGWHFSCLHWDCGNIEIGARSLPSAGAWPWKNQRTHKRERHAKAETLIGVSGGMLHTFTSVAFTWNAQYELWYAKVGKPRTWEIAHKGKFPKVVRGGCKKAFWTQRAKVSQESFATPTPHIG